MGFMGIDGVGLAWWSGGMDAESVVFGVVSGVACSLVAAYLKPWLDKGRRRAKFRNMARKEAAAAHLRHAASGIKGDGFSALFLLHRALHVRIRALGWLGSAGFCLLGSMLLSHNGWWLWGPLMLVAEACFFRAGYLGAKATGLGEVAEGAVKPAVEQTEADAVSQEAPEREGDRAE